MLRRGLGLGLEGFFLGDEGSALDEPGPVAFFCEPEPEPVPEVEADIVCYSKASELKIKRIRR